MAERNSVAEVFLFGLKHSVAQAFFVFSVALMLVAMWKATEYLFFSVYTLFYAVLNFKIEAIRKSPDLQDYAVGKKSGKWGATLYSTISLLLLLGWVVGSTLILVNYVSLLVATGMILGPAFLLLAWWIMWVIYLRQKDMNKLFPSDKIYVASSTIKNASRGVFAKAEIKKGEIIERCPIIEVPKNDVSNLKESILVNYYFYWGENKEKLAIALGFGSIYNHSYEPNATYKQNRGDMTIDFIASRDIGQDEEITVSYNFGNPDDKRPVTVAGVPPS